MCESRHRPPSSEERGQRRTIVCVFKESDALWVHADGGARDPSVVELQPYRSERRVTKTQRLGDTVWFVMAFTCANETCIATPRLMLNRCQSMSTIKKLNDKLTVKCDSRDRETSGIVTLRRHVERRSPSMAAFGEGFRALWD